ncbi:MAG: hypothetical protein KGO92_05575 [Bacteroidota bacterium]|nr:hypothetical protein [Bacteroidota bacterium]
MDESLQKLEDLSFEQLSAFINQLIDRDFSRLVQILYRLDVSEAKLKTILIENPTGDAGEMIAHLIIERIRQREEIKQKFPKDPNIPEEDKW